MLESYNFMDVPYLDNYLTNLCLHPKPNNTTYDHQVIGGQA